MNSPLHKLNKVGPLTAKLIFATMLVIAASASIADESNIAYVDSVHKWGAWELDIEPAAGGLAQPTTQVLNARKSKVTLRTNSFSALAPPPKLTVISTTPSTPIVSPVVPITPPPTPVTPPFGGPADGLF